MPTTAQTPEQYINELPEDLRQVFTELRNRMLNNLPARCLPNCRLPHGPLCKSEITQLILGGIPEAIQQKIRYGKKMFPVQKDQFNSL